MIVEQTTSVAAKVVATIAKVSPADLAVFLATTIPDLAATKVSLVATKLAR